MRRGNRQDCIDSRKGTRLPDRLGKKAHRKNVRAGSEGGATMKQEYIIQKPVVPCCVCKVVMVPLGPMGDTGEKKCQQCRDRLRYENVKKKGKRYYKLRTANCKRCGKTFEGTRKQVCDLCQIIIIDLYNHNKAKDCIYCGKPSGTKDFCNRTCMSNATNLLRDRRKKIDEVLCG